MRASLHNEDFHAWTEQQARLLPAGRLQDADLPHLIEEIEMMGAGERRELIDRLALLLAHPLKWQHKRNLRGRGWPLTIKEPAPPAGAPLEGQPEPGGTSCGIRRARRAVLMAARETGLEESTFPSVCPYSGAAILDPDFLPD